MKPKQHPGHVVAGLLDDARFTDACARRDMGAVFRMLNHRGVSTRRLAESAGISQGRLYDYMNGKSRVEKLSVFEGIADGLRIPGRLLGIAGRPWEPQAAPAGVTAQTVLHHLNEKVARRLVDSEGDVHAFAAAASFSEMAGWMAHDSGRDELAARHFQRALHLAHASGDWSSAGNVAAGISHLALQTGDPAKAAHWAGAGLDIAARGPSQPALTARLRAMSARAAAAAGQRAAAFRFLDQAHEALERPPAATHPWVSPFDTAALSGEAALVARDLADHDRALVYAERAIALREANRVRSLALNRITLVGVHARRADWDAVVHHGADLLTISPALGSVRVMRRMTALGRRLRQRCDHPPLREFVARLDDFTRTRSLLLADLIPRRDEGEGTET